MTKLPRSCAHSYRYVGDAGPEHRLRRAGHLRRCRCRPAAVAQVHVLEALRYLRSGPFECDPSAQQDVDAVRDFERLRRVLLDQEHTDAPLIGCITGPPGVGAQPSTAPSRERVPSASSRSGCRARARARVSILCSPPERSPARRPSSGSSSGKSSRASLVLHRPTRRLSDVASLVKTERSSVTSAKPPLARRCKESVRVWPLNVISRRAA